MHWRQTATTLPQLFVQNDKTPLQPLSRYAPEASTIIAKEISYFATDNTYILGENNAVEEILRLTLIICIGKICKAIVRKCMICRVKSVLTTLVKQKNLTVSIMTEPVHP